MTNMTDMTDMTDIDDIDESFDSKPVEVTFPELLSTDELNQIHGFLKGKSNKELSELVTKILTKNTDQNEMQKMQITNSIMKNLGTSSKRELLTTLDTILNSQNKHIIFESADKLVTIQNEEQKSSNDELRKKLHQKIFMSNKKNQQKMYEKMMNQFQKSQTETHEVQETHEVEETQNLKSNDDKKKKKKNNKINKKINSDVFQQNIIEQMTAIASQLPK